MGVRIVEDVGADMAVLYCSTSMWAFGPVFEDSEQAEDFLDWLPMDARTLSNSELEAKHDEWRKTSFTSGGEFNPSLRDEAAV
jgi:hypothetical protein